MFTAIRKSTGERVTVFSVNHDDIDPSLAYFLVHDGQEFVYMPAVMFKPEGDCLPYVYNALEREALTFARNYLFEKEAGKKGEVGLWERISKRCHV